MTMKLQNTLTRSKDEFKPIDESQVRLYACGPTVYSRAHIGNARMAVVFDQLVRVLRRMYPKVKYVSNITDVDDKIMAAAVETGEDISEITKKYTDYYNADMAALGVLPPDVQPRATEPIEEMKNLIVSLIERGHAYEAEGHVLFNVPSYEAYGKLSGRSRDEQVAGARVDVAPYKKDAADFVLWKPSSDDQPGWDSPWGRGRPGWHIECSAMAEKHLKLPFDIHGGGADLKFPHHENEIAQSCCAHGHEDDLSAFSKYWVHNGFVTVNGEKMSKSLGNFTVVDDLIAGREDTYGITVRMALLSAHYRKPLDWNDQIIHQAEALREKIDKAYVLLKDAEPDDNASSVYQPIMDALCDDLNTPLAFTKLAELLKEINKASENDYPRLKAILDSTLDVLGIVPDTGLVHAALSIDEQQHINALLAERQQARADKNFARADEIRDELDAMGIVIEDSPEGPKWRKAG